MKWADFRRIVPSRISPYEMQEKPVNQLDVSELQS
jgi:hypothetical protein